MMKLLLSYKGNNGYPRRRFNSLCHGRWHSCTMRFPLSESILLLLVVAYALNDNLYFVRGCQKVSSVSSIEKSILCITSDCWNERSRSWCFKFSYIIKVRAVVSCYLCMFCCVCFPMFGGSDVGFERSFARMTDWIS